MAEAEQRLLGFVGGFQLATWNYDLVGDWIYQRGYVHQLSNSRIVAFLVIMLLRWGIVLVLEGRGVAHMGGSQQDLEPGTCLHLPPGLLHCLENPGPGTLRVLGVFHPADSPAAKLQEHG